MIWQEQQTRQMFSCLGDYIKFSHICLKKKQKNTEGLTKIIHKQLPEVLNKIKTQNI